MEMNETVLQPSAPDTPHADPRRKEDKPEKKRVTVRISLFFDGTGNNRRNTDHRSTGSAVFKRIAESDKFQESSYFNDYSNVARLYMHTAGKAASGYNYYVKVYTEGIGTSDGDEDDVRGNVAGEGPTGVVAKVDKGLNNAIVRLGKLLKESEKYILERVTVDTFGFSRGATAARYCVYRILHRELQFDGNPPKETLKRRLEGAGFEVEKIDVKTVGLFDTVSSMGVAYIDVSDVTRLHLDAVKEAHAVLHLAAAEEYRVCFSLTNIDSAVHAGVGHQIYLPGAHSDVGGGYENGPGEDKVVWSGEGSEDISEFLRHYGWATAEEARVIGAHDRRARDHDIKKPIKQAHLRLWTEYVRLERKTLSNQYSFIPLHIMAKFAREQALPVRDGLESDYDPVDISGLSARLKAYAESAKASGASEASDWSYNVDPAVQELRHQYLHFSGKSEIGYNLRTESAGDFRAPIRRVYSDSA
jgi:hypothetical protein